MSLAELLVLALAVWRITELLQNERGPWGIFTRLRQRVGINHGEDGQPVSWPDTEIGYLARCFYCGSIWVGVGLAGLYFASPVLAGYLALPFGISAAAILIGEAKAWLERH